MEDYDLWLQLARDHELAFDPRTSVVVRRRAGSASGDLRAMAEEALEVLARALDAGLPEGALTAAEIRMSGSYALALVWTASTSSVICARRQARNSASNGPPFRTSPGQLVIVFPVSASNRVRQPSS